MLDYIVPDSVGEPLRAWRTWFVVPENKTNGDLRLRSFIYANLWKREVQEAVCKGGATGHIDREKYPPHEAPDDQHKCGIYASTTREGAELYYLNPEYSAQSWMEIWRVIGEVGLWGKIVPGTKGYRAQYAYPMRLEVPKRIKGRELHLSAKEVALSLENYYECEVELVEETLDLDPPYWHPLNRMYPSP